MFKSTVKVQGCTFENNFAIVGGVFSIESHSSLEIEDSVLQNNVAGIAPIADIFDSSNLQSVSNCTFKENVGLSAETLWLEISKELCCYHLKLLPEAFTDYIVEN